MFSLWIVWALDLIFDLPFIPSVGKDNWIVDFGLTFAGITNIKIMVTV